MNGKKNISNSHKGKPGSFLGKKHTLETIKKIKDSIKKRFPNGRSGKLHPNWKGDSVCYAGLHEWVVSCLGNPYKCEHCGIENLRPRQYNWANKSGRYKRILEDWIRLCVKCHAKYDGASEKMRGRKVSLKTRKKLALSKMGEKNPQWKGGITPEIKAKIKGEAIKLKKKTGS